MKHDSESHSFDHLPDTEVEGPTHAPTPDLLDELEAMRQAELPPRIAILGMYDLLLSDVTLRRTLSDARLWMLAERLAAPEDAGTLTVALLYEAIIDGAETLSTRIIRAAGELRAIADDVRRSPMSESPWLPLGLVRAVDIADEADGAVLVCAIEGAFEEARLAVVGAARAFLASIACGHLRVDVVVSGPAVSAAPEAL